MQHYILQVVTGQEQRAAKELEAMGIASVLPMRQATRRSSRSRSKPEFVRVPVLPGYLVISCNFIDWFAILKLKQVIRPIDIGGEPHPVGQDVVDAVAAMDGIEARQIPFALQQRVQVMDDRGQPTGMIGTIAKLLGIKLAQVRLDHLGTATVDIEKLEAA